MRIISLHSNQIVRQTDSIFQGRRPTRLFNEYVPIDRKDISMEALLCYLCRSDNIESTVASWERENRWRDSSSSSLDGMIPSSSSIGKMSRVFALHFSSDSKREKLIRREKQMQRNGFSLPLCSYFNAVDGLIQTRTHRHILSYFNRFHTLDESGCLIIVLSCSSSTRSAERFHWSHCSTHYLVFSSAFFLLF